MKRVVAVASLVAAVALTAAPDRWPVLAWVPFAVGAWAVMRVPARFALMLILAGGAALPLTAGLHPPGTSDDMYRYIWDGRVQQAGIDPYRYPPSAPQLTPLRDDFLWPQHSNWCIPSGCTLVNRPDVPTIYPPVAEAVFWAVSLAGGREDPMQLAMAGFALGVGAFLWYALRTLGRDPRRAVLWAWCPLVAAEAGNNAHVDVAGTLLAAVALWMLAHGRSAGGGAVLGLAIATKVTPALLLPAALRRRPVTVALTVVGAVLGVYLPHILAVGPKVLGYLPGYLQEEGFVNGNRFVLIGLVVPEPFVRPAAALILAAVALHVLRTGDPDRPWRGAAVMVVASLLVSAPSYPWYTMLLVMLVTYGVPVEWLVLGPAAVLAQFARGLGLATHDGQRIGYAVALVVIVAGLLLRRRLPRTPAVAASRPDTDAPRPAPGSDLAAGREAR